MMLLFWLERKRGFLDRKSTRLNSSHLGISYAVFCLKKKIVLLGMMLYYSLIPTVNALWLPLLLLLALVTSLGVGLWLSAMNVRYHDVQHVVPFLTQFWLFATPIAYPSSLLPEPWRTLYGLNPMTGVVEGFRWALLGANTTPGLMLLVSCIAAILVLVSGAYWFRRLEKTFADI